MSTSSLTPIPFLRITSVAALLTLAVSGSAPVRAATVDDLLARTFTNSVGQTLPYRLWVPAQLEPSRRYPLVLFLHGAGERGTDNRAQLAPNPDPLVFVAPDKQARWPCFFIAPQCPVGQTWAGLTQGDRWGDLDGTGDFTAEPTWPLAATMQMLSSLTNGGTYAEHIDLSRLYITGLSMGGYGTWEALSRWPGVFSAAIPICGGGDPERVGSLGRIPVWMFHAADDPVVPVVRSRQMTDALRHFGVIPRLTEYPAALTIGHASWRPAYADPELVPWLFGAVDAGARPQFSLPSGLYGSNITVVLSFPEPDAEIRWTRDGTIPNVQSSLFTGPIPIEVPATLRAMAFRSNRAISAVSSSDYLITPSLETPVVSRTVPVGTTVTFEVAARGVGELTFQWLRDGIELSGAISSSLTITNAQLGDNGIYEVLVTDALGNSARSAGTLIAAIKPTIVLPPENQTITAGDDVTFTVAATNTAALPIGFIWRKSSSVAITNFVLHSRESSLTLFDVGTNSTTLSGPGTYRVILTNGAAPFVNPSSPNVTFTLNVLPATAPTAATLVAADLAPDRATLGASINPNGAQTVAWFEFGTNTAYGNNSTPVKVGNSTEAISFNQSIGNLAPATTYHYRVAVTNHGGMALGQDLSVTTPNVGPAINAFSIQANGQFHLEFVAAGGSSYDVLVSTNLIDWTAAGLAIEITPGHFEFTDAESPSLPTRFYELRPTQPLMVR